MCFDQKLSISLVTWYAISAIIVEISAVGVGNASFCVGIMRKGSTVRDWKAKIQTGFGIRGHAKPNAHWLNTLNLFEAVRRVLTTDNTQRSKKDADKCEPTEIHVWKEQVKLFNWADRQFFERTFYPLINNISAWTFVFFYLPRDLNPGPLKIKASTLPLSHLSNLQTICLLTEFNKII